jgi:hypothetical protein
MRCHLVYILYWYLGLSLELEGLPTGRATDNKYSLRKLAPNYSLLERPSRKYSMRWINTYTMWIY